MPLTPGSRLGPYEISALIGQGGMGEVYRAHDTTLGRDVAIKVLPDAWATDGDRLARLTREARALAALNHPNIAQIHGVETTSQGHALVMELVEGPDLAERLARGPLPITEALAIARQIALALEAAHEQGLVHRDLKPANVKVKDDGTVKVLDFGLAKAVASDLDGGGPQTDLANSPTMTSPAMTAMGMILGTAAYMAPEQARGKRVDKRADLWAFGCVLFEMLTGTRAFEAEDVSLTLSKVLQRDPDLDRLPAGTPASVRQTIALCLKKDPRERIADIQDVRLALDGAFATGTPTAAPSAVPAPRWRTVLPWALVVAATAIAAALAWPGPGIAPVNGAVVRAMIDFPQSAMSGARLGGLFAISPDGARLVYVANPDGQNRLYARRLDQLEATAIPGTEDALSPFFSPDGSRVGFFAGGKLKVVALAGGRPVPLADAPNPTGGSWGSDGTIVYAPDQFGLKRVADTGGEAQVLTRVSDAVATRHAWPHVLPGSRTALFTEWRGPGRSRVDAVTLATGEVTQGVIESGAIPMHVQAGYLVYAHPAAAALWAVPFDPQTARASGKPALVVQSTMASMYAAQYTVSTAGTLVYLPNTTVESRELVWVGRQGVASTAVPERLPFGPLRLSWDGRRVAFSLYEGLNPKSISIYDFDRGVMTGFTSEGFTNSSPAWLPDGSRLVFASNRAGIQNLLIGASDGTGEPVRLTTSERLQVDTALTPDGQTLMYRENGSTTGFDLWTLSLAGDSKPTPWLATPASEHAASFSPDGRWVAYLSNQTGRQEVYVLPFPGPGPRTQVSFEGGTEPLFSPKGGELFYRQGEKMMVVDVTTGETFTASRPRVLFEGRFEASFQVPGFRFYDTHDGQRFLMVKSDRPQAPPQLVVVLNWLEELKRTVR